MVRALIRRGTQRPEQENFATGSPKKRTLQGVLGLFGGLGSGTMAVSGRRTGGYRPRPGTTLTLKGRLCSK